MAKKGHYGCNFIVCIAFLVLGLYSGQELGRWSVYLWRRPVEINRLDRSTKGLLFNEVKVFCWVLTHAPTIKTKARAVADTWGLLCNRIMFVSNISDDRLPVLVVKLNDTRDELWKKSKKAFTWIYRNVLNDYDWFLKADDDTYMHMDNLRKLLQEYSPHDDVAIGHHFYVPRKHISHHSGGAGYVLSRNAVRRLVSEGFAGIDVCKKPNPFEDVFISECLDILNVTMIDGADENGTYRFHPIALYDFLNNHVPDWMHLMSKTKVKLSAEFVLLLLASLHLHALHKPKDAAPA